MIGALDHLLMLDYANAYLKKLKSKSTEFPSSPLSQAIKNVVHCFLAYGMDAAKASNDNDIALYNFYYHQFRIARNQSWVQDLGFEGDDLRDLFSMGYKEFYYGTEHR